MVIRYRERGDEAERRKRGKYQEWKVRRGIPEGKRSLRRGEYEM